MSVVSEFNNLKELIESILEHNEECRSNDTKLFVECCKHLGVKTLDQISDSGINMISVHKLRQVIQNKEHKFLPSDSVIENRSKRNFDIKKYMVNFKAAN
ncbi:hypothetical protein [Schinkia azotoformans]|uniref:hypothetical protein n=1 Tax=Schinkia azotoformans TaxID=1454 RepID=UPI002DBC2B99|nr:hypothetical protein [Schinkia azotoformans]MEC1768299.1 hypothetical protein [Schinkia azotoformans]